MTDPVLLILSGVLLALALAGAISVLACVGAGRRDRRR